MVFVNVTVSDVWVIHSKRVALHCENI